MALQSVKYLQFCRYFPKAPAMTFSIANPMSNVGLNFKFVKYIKSY